MSTIGDTEVVDVSQPVDSASARPKWVWLAFLLATGLYAGPAVWMLRVYIQPAFDLAIYDQSLWLIAHGEVFNTVGGGHIFGTHFSPVLYPLSLLSWLPGGAVPELVAQGLLVASGVFPAWKLGQLLERDPRWFVLAYALHPALFTGSWYGFRPWNLAAPVFMWLLVWLVRSPSVGRMVAFGLVMLVFREDLALWVGLASLILFIGEKIRFRQLLFAAIPLAAVSFFILLKVIPAFSPTNAYVFVSLQPPSPFTAQLFVSSAVMRVLFLFTPLAVIPTTLNWKLTLPLLVPIAGLVALGGNAVTTFYHYDMMFVPLLLLIVGLSPKAETHLRLIPLLAIVVAMLIGPLRPFEPLFGPNPFKYDMVTVNVYDQLKSELESLPAHQTESISAPAHLLTHFAERQNAFIYPNPADPHPSGVFSVLRFNCPEPNLVVSDDRIPAPTWEESTVANYRATFKIGDTFTTWVRKEITAHTPCSSFIDSDSQSSTPPTR